MSRKRLVVGNWKMYVESPREAEQFAKSLRKKARAFVGAEAWLAPSLPHLVPVAQALAGSSIKAGAQTISIHEGGAHTGEVSASQLKQAGASFVIVGHSERRAAGDSDEAVHAQLNAALGAGLVAILCVGETEREPDGSHWAQVANEISRALAGAVPIKNRLVVAYEPVWAIGKSGAEAIGGEDLEEAAIFIRKILSECLGREAARQVPILYGGSVEPANARALIEQGGINGFLVGRASADVDSFIEILKAVRLNSR
jgi:triosephosphate isomerase